MGNNSSSNIGTSKILNNERSQAWTVSIHNHGESFLDDDLEINDELYVMSDDDEMNCIIHMLLRV